MPPKRQSAFSKALREAQQSAEEPQDVKTEAPQSGITREQDSSITSGPENSIAEKPQSVKTVKSDNVKTVKHENGKTAKQQNGKTEEEEQVKATEKITLYLTPEQLDKLDDLAIAYKKQTRKRTNHNKLLRKLIDKATLNDIL